MCWPGCATGRESRKIKAHHTGAIAEGSGREGAGGEIELYTSPVSLKICMKAAITTMTHGWPLWETSRGAFFSFSRHRRCYDAQTEIPFSRKPISSVGVGVRESLNDR
ncbi:hypothetical protein MPER_12439 [Moniliophthora perniciosa FA553]|nr:hypothetical protein MPER_12439 [Moniliophthora perniciosa FA553]